MMGERRFDDPFARGLRGFGPGGILAFLGVLVVGTLLGVLRAVPVLLWTWRSGTPWREIGFARPRSWGRNVAVGVARRIEPKLFMKALAMAFVGAPAGNPPFR